MSTGNNLSHENVMNTKLRHLGLISDAVNTGEFIGDME